MTASNLIIKPPATVPGENCGLKRTLNGHVVIFLSPCNVDFCSGQWVLIANQCKVRCWKHWDWNTFLILIIFFYP